MAAYSPTKCKLFVAGSKVKKAYIGNQKVYSAGNIVTYRVDTNVVYTEEVDEGASCLSPKTFTPVKSGWTFLGWRIDATASATVFTSKVMGDTPITLYAVFTTGVTVGYYNGTASIKTQTKMRYYNNGNVVNPSFTLSQAALSGWTARGWSTGNTAAASILYSNGATFSRDSNVTLYGMYYQAITLSYNGNGSTSGTTAVQRDTRYYNSRGVSAEPTFTLQTNGFAKTGYTFTKWAFNASGGAQYAAGAKITLAASATMYAVWRPTNIISPLLAQVTAPEIVTGFRNVWYSTPLDLTNVSSITFTYNYYYVDRGYDNQKYYYNTYAHIVGVSNDKANFTVSNSFECGNHTYANEMSGTKSVTINVSSLTGNYYIGAGVKGYNSYKGGDAVLDSYAEQTYYTQVTSVTFK